MLKSHLVTIASHTKTHRNVTQLDENDLEKEICDSKTGLEKQFKVPVRTFIYPS